MEEEKEQGKNDGLAPFYNITIIVDTVLRKKRNFKHEKQ